MLRYLGELCLVLGITALVPALGAALLGEFPLVLPYGAVAGALVGLGAIARRLPAPRDLQRHEALVVTAAVFVLTPVVLSGPLVLQGLPWIDALFEAVSGVTTTGLSTLPYVEGRPRTFLLARAWMQWVGGLGFVVLCVALTLEPGMGARRLGTPGLDPADVPGSMRAHARRVLLTYLVLTLVGIGLLVVLGSTVFEAVVHTFAGVSTGGFAPRDSSLAGLARPLQSAILGLALLGAMSLPLYSELRRGRWRRVRSDPEARALVVLIVVGTVLLAVSMQVAGAASAMALADIALLAVSAQTTAGFSTVRVPELPDLCQGILILAMLTGGAHGSTAGGIKLLRILMVVRLVQWQIARARLPAHAVSAPRLSGHRLEASELLPAAALVLLFVGVVVLSWLPFLALGHPPLPALFEVVSATGTVGLSAGITGPDLEPGLKAVLCMDMLLGRLEVFAVLVALSPRTWIGRRAS